MRCGRGACYCGWRWFTALSKRHRNRSLNLVLLPFLWPRICRFCQRSGSRRCSSLPGTVNSNGSLVSECPTSTSTQALIRRDQLGVSVLSRNAYSWRARSARTACSSLARACSFGALSACAVLSASLSSSSSSKIGTPSRGSTSMPTIHRTTATAFTTTTTAHGQQTEIGSQEKQTGFVRRQPNGLHAPLRQK